MQDNQDEVSLPSRSGAPGGPNSRPPAGAPQYRAASSQQPQHQQPQNQQPQQQSRPPVQEQAPRPVQQPQFSTTPRISPQDQNAIPHTSNPVEMDVLLGQLNLSMTIGEGDYVKGDITISEGKSMVVKGRVEGKINCPGVLIITKTGMVEGSISGGQCWIEGEVTNELGNSMIDVGVLHLGVGSKVAADCAYDQLSISSPNGGISGRMNARNSIPPRNG